MTTPRLPTAERQRQIAEAALRIISRRGVRSLTAAALAAEVGIADGTIFRHFKNKQAIVEAAITLFEAALEQAYPQCDGSPLENLGDFVVCRLTLMRKNPELLQLAFGDRLAEAGGEHGAERVARIVGRSVNFIRTCLLEAQEDGTVSREVPVALLVWMVIGVVRGASSQLPCASRGQESLSSEAPEVIWKAMDRFLRSTGEGAGE